MNVCSPNLGQKTQIQMSFCDLAATEIESQPHLATQLTGSAAVPHDAAVN
jgi:hypothetical protein